MTTKYIHEKLMKIPYDNLVREYLADLRLRNLSPNTISIYEKVLRRFARHLRRGQPDAEILLSAITPEATKEYVAHRMGQRQVNLGHSMKPVVDRPLSISTIHQEVRSLRTFGVWLGENGYRDPFKELKTPKLPKLPKHLIEILSTEEISRLFQAYNPNTHIGARWQAILAFFLDTGVRVEELVTLKMADLDLDNLRAKVRGKGDKERYVVFGNRAYRLLSRYLNLYRPQGAPSVFLALEGTPLTLNGVQNIVKHARKRCGVTRAHCHLFRHTFATNFLLAGGNAFELQALLGHESLEMTKKYTHLAAQLSRLPIEMRRPSPLDELDRSGQVKLGNRGRAMRWGDEGEKEGAWKRPGRNVRR